MARKRQTTVPKVPRSNVVETGTARRAPVANKSRVKIYSADTPAASTESLAKEYAHVGRDLRRIGLLGVLIFGAMFALKAVGL